MAPHLSLSTSLVAILALVASSTNAIKVTVYSASGYKGENHPVDVVTGQCYQIDNSMGYEKLGKGSLKVSLDVALRHSPVPTQSFVLTNGWVFRCRSQMVSRCRCGTRRIARASVEHVARTKVREL